MFDQETITALLVLFNTIFVAIFAFYTRKRIEIEKEKIDEIKKNPIKAELKSQEELWGEMNEIRDTLNKTLVAVNKQLRGHGRTVQAGKEKSFDGSKPGLLKNVA